MGIPNGIMAMLQKLKPPPTPDQPLPGTDTGVGPRPDGYTGDVPEFNVRTGEPLSIDDTNGPAISMTMGNGNPPLTSGDENISTPVEGDKENSLLKDMGTMPGTGLANTPSSDSTLSSTPSGAGTPSTNRGDANDSLTTAIPKIQLPDINTMPGTDRLNALKSQLDTNMNPPSQPWWKKLIKYGMMVAPVAIGAGYGGIMGAGAAAGGVADESQILKQNKLERDRQLQSEISEQGQERTAQYETAGHVAQANVQNQTNALIRDAILHNTKDIASGHDATSIANTGTKTDSTETIAGNRLDQQKIVDQSKILLQRAQASLDEAKKGGVAAQIAFAQRHLQLAEQNAQLAADTHEANFFGTQGGQPIPGAPTDGQGHVIGFRPASATGMTGQTRSRIQSGGAIEQGGNDLIQYIDQNRDVLGPMMGRVHSLADLVSLDTPASKELGNQFESWLALQPAFHGFRGVSALSRFEEKAGGFNQDPDSLIGSIKGIMKAVGSASKGMEGATTGIPAGPGTATPRGLPTTPPPTSAPSTGQVIEFKRGPDGKIVRATQ